MNKNIKNDEIKRCALIYLIINKLKEITNDIMNLTSSNVETRDDF